jgi:hypothetical protein
MGALQELACCGVVDPGTCQRRAGAGASKGPTLSKKSGPGFLRGPTLRHEVHPPAPSIFTLCHDIRRCQRMATANNRRRMVNAASSGVGAMRRGHCACKFDGHPWAAPGGYAVVKSSHETGTPSVTLRRFLIICPSQSSASRHRSERWPPRLSWCGQYPSAGIGCEPGYSV